MTTKTIKADKSINALQKHLVKECVKVVFPTRKTAITIITCSDQYMLEMNKATLNHDYYTDIITYHYENTPTLIEAELLISVDRISENAKKYKIPFEHELARVVIHGCLHLYGYEDKTPELKSNMTEAENKHLLLIFPNQTQVYVPRGTKD